MIIGFRSIKHVLHNYLIILQQLSMSGLYGLAKVPVHLININIATVLGNENSSQLICMKPNVLTIVSVNDSHMPNCTDRNENRSKCEDCDLKSAKLS